MSPPGEPPGRVHGLPCSQICLQNGQGLQDILGEGLQGAWLGFPFPAPLVNCPGDAPADLQH